MAVMSVHSDNQRLIILGAVRERFLENSTGLANSSGRLVLEPLPSFY